jgi:hypothetical protein
MQQTELNMKAFRLISPAAMHLVDVEFTETGSRGGKNDHSEMRDCMPIEFGRQLGERIN